MRYGVADHRGSTACSRRPAVIRLLALGQVLTSPLLLIVFAVGEPGLIPEWPRYVWLSIRCVMDGKPR